MVRLFYTMVSAAATEEEKEVIAETSDAVSDVPVATDERDVAESVDDSPVSVKLNKSFQKKHNKSSLKKVRNSLKRCSVK